MGIAPLWGGRFRDVWQMAQHPEVMPDPYSEPTGDPMYGFDNGRVERVTKLTNEDYYSAKLPPKACDYCADILLEYHVCRRQYWPFPFVCSNEKHAYMHCLYEDYVLRMREYERERRLLERGIIKKCDDTSE